MTTVDIKPTHIGIILTCVSLLLVGLGYWKNQQSNTEELEDLNKIIVEIDHLAEALQKQVFTHEFNHTAIDNINSTHAANSTSSIPTTPSTPIASTTTDSAWPQRRRLVGQRRKTRERRNRSE